MKIHLQKRPHRHDNSRCGFALVLALSMMAFVLVIVLAMSTLVTVELRSSTNEIQMNAARANARMGLMLAIGELQEHAGPDTRVTAPGDIVAGGDGSHRVTGVWRSWEGLDHDETIGLPGYDSEYSTSSAPPNYPIKTVDYDADNPEEGRFLAWLVSEQGDWSAKKAPLLDERVGSSVPLLASGTLGANSADNEVHVIPTPSTANEGSFAWWVSGENQKANLSAPATTPISNEAWDQHLTSAGQPDTTFFGLSTPDELSNAASRDSLDLMSKDAGTSDKLGGENFHHLTVHSRGLLTNTATGGWRRDLSLMTEQWDDLPDDGLPFYTIKPGVESSVEKANSDSLTNFQIYPWAWRGSKNRPTAPLEHQTNAVTSWNALRDFCVQYKSISSGSADGQIVMPAKAGGKPAWIYVNPVRDSQNRFPVIARMHWVFSYSSKSNPDPAATDGNAYIACIVATPVVTMWNPYNVELNIKEVTISDNQMSPIELTVHVGDTSYDPYPISIYRGLKFTGIDDNVETGTILYGATKLEPRGKNGETELTFKPGETRVFSPQEQLTDIEGTNDARRGSVTLELRDGYRTQRGFRFELRDPDTKQLITGKAEDIFKVDVSFNGRLDNENKGGGNFGDFDLKDQVGMYLFYSAKSVDISAGNTVPGWYMLNMPAEDVEDYKYWGQKQLAVNNNKRLEDLEGIADAFCASLFGSKISNQAGILSKGILHSNPLVSVSKTSWRTDDGTTVQARGAKHPVNWPYDFKFMMLNQWGDPGCPSGLSGDTTGYIGPSHEFNSALDRLVMAHMPVRPIQSIAQLQHFDIRQNNHVPPYQYNIIGNSHAQPLFAANAVAHLDRLSEFSIGDCQQYDDSYIANHLLFDDWFVSSIAPDTKAYSAAENRGLEEVYEDHLTGVTALPNHRYLPANPTEDAASQAAKDLTASTAWQPWYHVASKLEVHGMFNVNSTSVDAWTALLRHLKDAKVPTLDREGSISLDSGDGYPFGRDALAGEAVAGGGTNNSGFTEATEYTGYRRFTDDQIDALAEQMVEEIKARGPFLSLSEFINRRLTAKPEEENLARAGVVEAALLHLSELGASAVNPYRELQAVAGEVTALPDGNHDYRFAYAALGSTAYGYPGWTRQADVLRPLAPILSARDDTFTIRAYGDVKDLNGKVVARAWCEAIVKRSADYVDSTDANTDLPGIEGADSKSVNLVNQQFGRRFEIVSFRWLPEKEV
jgi:hypothetical protein